jgi:HK97 family phage major capsid protein
MRDTDAKAVIVNAVEQKVEKILQPVVQELKTTHGDFMEEMRRVQDEHRDRIEELEAKGSSAGKTSDGSTANDREHTRIWTKALRGRFADPASLLELSNYERKDVTTGTGSAGGFAVPEEIAREIGRLELLLSPVRRLVKVVAASSSDFKLLVSRRGSTSGWVGETGTRTATTTSSTFRSGLRKRRRRSSPLRRGSRSSPATAPAGRRG